MSWFAGKEYCIFRKASLKKAPLNTPDTQEPTLSSNHQVQDTVMNFFHGISPLFCHILVSMAAALANHPSTCFTRFTNQEAH